MYIIEANNEKYSIPTSWKDIKLGQYTKYLDELLPEPTDPVAHIKWQYDVTAHFAGFPEGFKDIFPYEDTAQCFALIAKALTTPPDKTPVEAFVFNGILYRCPVSNTVMNRKIPMAKITTGELLDSMQISQNMDLAKNDIKALNLLIATLYRPENVEYDSNETEALATLFNDLPMDTCFGCSFFLTILLSSSNRHILSSLENRN